jgi:hypothetical protein
MIQHSFYKSIKWIIIKDWSKNPSVFKDLSQSFNISKKSSIFAVSIISLSSSVNTNWLIQVLVKPWLKINWGATLSWSSVYVSVVYNITLSCLVHNIIKTLTISLFYLTFHILKWITIVFTFTRISNNYDSLRKLFVFYFILNT